MFLSLPANPVPGFLVYDQPSQVYFPRRLVERRDSRTAQEPAYCDEDVIAVHEAFAVLAEVAAEAKGGPFK
jgi:hypothetical protein